MCKKNKPYSLEVKCKNSIPTLNQTISKASYTAIRAWAKWLTWCTYLTVYCSEISQACLHRLRRNSLITCGSLCGPLVFNRTPTCHRFVIRWVGWNGENIALLIGVVKIEARCKCWVVQSQDGGERLYGYLPFLNSKSIQLVGL